MFKTKELCLHFTSNLHASITLKQSKNKASVHYDMKALLSSLYCTPFNMQHTEFRWCITCHHTLR